MVRVVLSVALLALLLGCSLARPSAEPMPPSTPGTTIVVVAPARTAAPPATPDPADTRGHVAEGTRVDYLSDPPTVGMHYGRTARYGLHDRAVAPGYWLHNLEHGAAVFLYRCPDACPQLVSQLAEAYASFPAGKFGEVKLVISPYSTLDAPLMALAWGQSQRFQTFDRAALLAFYTQYLDRGPEDAR